MTLVTSIDQTAFILSLGVAPLRQTEIIATEVFKKVN